ncbi:MAG: response regulator [Candidatus Thermoplasmatota archaeon]
MGNNKKILVVDDDQHILQMFKDVLGLYGYEVILVNDGKEAIAEYKKQKPDLVIMDILMPKVDGIRTTKEILKIDKEAKIIVVTAVTKPGLEKTCLEAGAKAFIMKPFEIYELTDTIQKILGDKL